MGARDTSASLVCTVLGATVSADLSATAAAIGYDPLYAGRISWGDGSFTDVSAPFTTYEHTYTAGGVYTIVFWAWTSHGRRDNDESTVTVLSPTAEIAFAAAPSAPVVGQQVNFSDSNTATWGATVAAGGTDHILARWNGTNWTVVGK